MSNSMRTYIISRNPKEFPGKFVTHRVVIEPNNDLIPDPEPLAVVDTLQEARDVVPLEANVCFKASPTEEPHIVETWL